MLPRPPRNRGFYVKMKLKNHHRPSSSDNNNPNLLSLLCRKKYFKSLLFISLAFFFLSTFLITHNQPTTSISKTTLSHPNHARALIEQFSTNPLPKTNIPIFKDMKVYIYDLPSKYNSDWLEKNERCSTHLFASEVALHKALLDSEVRTLDPWQADFFFVPVYVSCNFSKLNGFPAIGHARSLIQSAIQDVSSQLPFWNRSSGSDHVFVASHDFGSCFHTMEDMAKADGVPEFLKKSIVLQTFGVHGKHPCQEVENVLIPPYVSPEKIRSTLQTSPLTGERDIFAFFRGKMEIHPKNISGRFYSKQVRTKIWRKYGNNRKFHLRRDRFPGYQSEIARSKFCLCPLGWAPWSPRLVESVALGCVPVIIADGIRLPFASVVPWSEISLTVPEAELDKLGKVLDHVAATNLSLIQRNLWDPEVRKALLYNEPLLEGDATWQVLASLSDKLERSHKKSRVSSQ